MIDGMLILRPEIKKRLKGLQREAEKLPSSLPENGDNPSPLLNYKITLQIIPGDDSRMQGCMGGLYFRVGVI